jgi:carbamoyl-phosphate synthase large subunit
MPVLVDRFLDDAIEIDVDALFDGTELYIGGIMEHIEEAGIHSGDSACSLPPITLGQEVVDRIRSSTLAIARGVGVRGLINIQYALTNDILYVLEANPRASRTVPFVSKATDTQLAKAAALIMTGATIAELRGRGMLRATGDGTAIWRGMPICVKEAVMPFNRFHTREGGAVDALLGPEMRSTGEVMGIDKAFEVAFAKTQIGVYGKFPIAGDAFVSVGNRDKRHASFALKRLAELGFTLWATTGTATMMGLHGVEVQPVRKIAEGEQAAAGGVPTATELINADRVQLIFNTPNGTTSGGAPRADGNQIRSAAIAHEVPCITTVQGLEAAVEAIDALQSGEVEVRSLQEWSAQIRRGSAS